MSSSKRRKLNGAAAAAAETLAEPSASHGRASSPPEQSAQDAAPSPPADVPADPPNEPVAAAEAKTFAELGIIDSLCEACANLKYAAPTPIQRAAIPVALRGRDVIGLAETGSGKTAAFALPILQALMARPQPLFALVLAPTRELAYQTAAAIDALGATVAVRTAVVVGGLDMTPQAIALAKKPHVIIATPGRLLDHLENTKGFSLRALKYLVLDEADRLLDLDFGAIVDKILAAIPRGGGEEGGGRRTMLFSATMNSKVEALQRASLRDPVRVAVAAGGAADGAPTVAALQQSYLFFPHKEKDLHLAYVLAALAGQRAIVFARTVAETQRLAILLRALGFSAIPLHGQLPQSARLGALGKFRAGARDVLVATDVAARGLDVPRVDAVLNYDLPPDSTTYVHRVGRTARAGRAGRSVSFVTQYDVELWQRVEAALGGRRLPAYPAPRDEVRLLAARVGEAQRLAAREMRDLTEAKKGGRGGRGAVARARGKMGAAPAAGRRARDDGMDRDEG